MDINRRTPPQPSQFSCLRWTSLSCQSTTYILSDILLGLPQPLAPSNYWYHYMSCSTLWHIDKIRPSVPAEAPPNMTHVSSSLCLLNLVLFCLYMQIICFNDFPEVHKYLIIPRHIDNITSGWPRWSPLIRSMYHLFIYSPFLLTRPSGPGQSGSRLVRLSVCLFVCLFVTP